MLGEIFYEEESHQVHLKVLIELWVRYEYGIEL